MKFPNGFMIGSSLSPFQFEQGLPGSEDPNSDWWVWVHDPENIAAGLVSGDLPENGPGYWALFKQDHDLAESLGMNTLRLGVEWSRVFPKPTFEVEVPVDCDEEGNITSIDVDEKALEKLDRLANSQAVDHYRRIFTDWVERGGRLIINAYHWPLPTWLHDPVKVRKLGPDRAPSGWLDEKTVVEFAKYSAYLAWKFGDLADMWSTMNEPNVVYEQGYMFVKGGFPPGYLSFEAAEKAKRNMIHAHARAYDNMKKHARKPVGLIYAFPWFEALGEGGEFLEAVKSRGVYEFTDMVIKGYSARNPVLRKDLEKRVDWIGVNYYSRVVFQLAGGNPVAQLGYGFLCTPQGVSRAGRPCSDFGWEVYPEGLYFLLKEIRERYGDLDIIVTENGVSDRADRIRPSFLVSHVHAVVKALGEGVPVKGYLHWSLIDNYEWAQGFRQRFGLVEVDLESKKRYLRPSALVFREIANYKGVPEELTRLSMLS
ncbi:MAG: beta-galactosidase BgaS [Thermosphaera sp.]